MKKHTIRGWTAVDRITVLAGCVPKPNQAPPVVANPDLRGMALPPGWNGMTTFNLSEGNTTHLPAFPNSLVTIHVEKNRLQELPDIPAGVTNLHVKKNQLTMLPALPAGLQFLEAAYNNLSEIPTPIPATLRHLSLTHNNIQSLPSLAHTQIRGLGLGFNQLKALPVLPNTLMDLGCANNQITRIANLPDMIRVLSCSNNPLRELKIDNLSRLEILIANNCGLREIPVLPPPPGGDDDDNNNGGGGAESFRKYYFDNNPLDVPFAGAYQRYKEGTSSPQTFRQEVLAEHRRMLRSRAATLSAIQQTLKAKGGPLEGNFNPANLVAQFITGLPGTIERQSLGVLEQREAVGNVEAGTAAAARRRIANLAVRPGPSNNAAVQGPLTREQNTLAKRAKLYLRPQNVTAAKARYQADLERRLEELRIADAKKEAMRVYANVLYEFKVANARMSLEEVEAERDVLPLEQTSRNIQAFTHNMSENFETLELFVSEEEIVDLYTGYSEAIQNKAVRKYARAVWKRGLIEYIKSRRPRRGDILERAREYPQWYTQDGSTSFVLGEMRLMNEIADLIFPEEITEEEIAARQGGVSPFLGILLTLLDDFETNLEAVDDEDDENNDDVVVNPQDDLIVEAVEGVVAAAPPLVNNDGADNDEDDAPAAGLVAVVNNNNNNGEALPIAMAAQAANNAALVNNAALAALANNADLAANLALLDENNQGGGRRKHRTPRNKKSKRQTRRH